MGQSEIAKKKRNEGNFYIIKYIEMLVLPFACFSRMRRHAFALLFLETIGIKGEKNMNGDGKGSTRHVRFGVKTRREGRRGQLHTGVIVRVGKVDQGILPTGYNLSLDLHTGTYLLSVKLGRQEKSS